MGTQYYEIGLPGQEPEGAVLVCTTTGRAFGPVFRDLTHAVIWDDYWRLRDPGCLGRVQRPGYEAVAALDARELWCRSEDAFDASVMACRQWLDEHPHVTADEAMLASATVDSMILEHFETQRKD